MKNLYVVCLLMVGCHHYHPDVHSSNCTVSPAPNGSTISCPDGSSQFVSNGSTGSTGASGADGSNGNNGSNGHNALVSSAVADPSLCSNGGTVFTMGTDQNDDSVLQLSEITTSAVVCNGLNGTNGSNGSNGLNVPPTPFTPASLVEPCASNPNNPSASDLANPNLEVFLKLSNGMLIASVSMNLAGYDTHFGVVTPGTWQSTGTNSNCVFTVDSNGIITN